MKANWNLHSIRVPIKSRTVPFWAKEPPRYAKYEYKEYVRGQFLIEFDKEIEDTIFACLNLKEKYDILDVRLKRIEEPYQRTKDGKIITVYPHLYDVFILKEQADQLNRELK